MHDRVEQQFGNYQLTRLIGEGRTAQVYLGQHIHVKERQAAIKVLRGLIEDETERKAFHHEATILARLHHAHITQLLDFGMQDDIPYIVTAYAPHGNMEQRYPIGKRVPLTTISRYVQQIGDALAYAHEQQVVHSDLKPNNLLLDSDDNIVVADFGFARIIQTTSQHQSSQPLGANCFYCAPEQFDLAPPSPASDQYALGIIIYQWISGQRPFNGTDPELLYQHLSVDPPSLCSIVPNLSPQIETVLFRVLAKDPQQRFDTIRDFVHAFTEAVETAHQSSSEAESPTAEKVLQQEQALLEQTTPGTHRRVKIASITIGGLLLLWFVFFVCPISSLQNALTTINFLTNATAQAQALVTYVHSSDTISQSGTGGTSDIRECQLGIKFSPTKNHTISLIINGDSNDCPAQNSSITVIYEPGNPYGAEIPSQAWWAMIGSVIFMLFFGLCACGIIGACYHFMLRKQGK